MLVNALISSVARRLPGAAVPGFRAGLALALAGWFSLAASAQDTARYAGRPFIQIARTGASDPLAGSITGFGRAQVAGDAVVFASMTGVSATGLFAGRGGPLSRVAGIGTSAAGDTLTVFHDGFARSTGPQPDLVFAAGPGRADGLYRWNGASFIRVLAGGSALPDSGGRVANVMGEPHLAGGALAVIAAHRPTGGLDDFRGVYRVKDGALVAVADTAHPLAGGFGTPEAFSSQVGFDGTTLAFWAGREPFARTQGMFAQDGTGTVRLLTRTGDALPDGGVISGLISPPVVADGAVYFFAHDEARVSRLLRHAAGTLTVLARDGDPTPEGTPLQSLGQLGLAVENGRAFFAALSGSGAGVYVVEGGALKTVIAPGAIVAGLRPTAITLQDVSDDTVVLDVSSGVNRRLAANLPLPAPPVLLESPTNTTVAVGARVEWRVRVLGDAPLAYRWQFSSPTGLVTRSTSDSLVIEAADVSHLGYYSLQVTNASGVASAPSFLLNVQAPPRFLSQAAPIRVEEGDALQVPVIASGGLPLGFHWTRDGSPVTSDSAAQGFFYRTSVAPSDAGRYRVVVSNAWGQATSDEIVVEVTPPAPNPTFAGGQFTSVFDARTPVPGGTEPFATDGLAEQSAQLRGSRVLFSGGPASNPQDGIFAWENGVLTTLVRAGLTLPNGLGAATGFTLVDASPDSPAIVYGFQPVNNIPQPVGIYRATPAGGLEVLVDLKSPVPGNPAASFPTFFGGAVHAADRLLFGAVFGGKPSLYLADGGGLRRLVGAEQDLPVVGTNSIQFTGLSFDGTHAVAVAATTGLQKAAVLKFGLDGSVVSLLSQNDPVPGTADTVRSIGQARIVGDTVYVGAYNASFAPMVLEIRDGVVRRLAAAGMQVGTFGTLQRLASPTPVVGGGRVYLAASVTTPTGTVQAIVAAGPSGIEPALVLNKLDGRRLSSGFAIAAEGDRFLAGIQLTAGARALYGNLGQASAPAPQLAFSRSANGSLRLTVPTGTILEAAATLGGTWTDLPGTGDVAVPTDGSARFFRLRQP